MDLNKSQTDLNKPMQPSIKGKLIKHLSYSIIEKLDKLLLCKSQRRNIYFDLFLSIGQRNYSSILLYCT